MWPSIRRSCLRRTIPAAGELNRKGFLEFIAQAQPYPRSRRRLQRLVGPQENSATLPGRSAANNLRCCCRLVSSMWKSSGRWGCLPIQLVASPRQEERAASASVNRMQAEQAKASSTGGFGKGANKLHV